MTLKTNETMSCPWSYRLPGSKCHHRQMVGQLVIQLCLQVTWRNFSIPSTAHELPAAPPTAAPAPSSSPEPITAPLAGHGPCWLHWSSCRLRSKPRDPAQRVSDGCGARTRLRQENIHLLRRQPGAAQQRATAPQSPELHPSLTAEAKLQP